MIGPVQGLEVDYLAEIKPLLERKCYACHGAQKQKGGLRLDTGNLIRKGGESGAALVTGNPEDSLLLKKVSATDETERMPQEAGALSSDEIALLRRWILAGAKSPTDEKPMKDPRSYWSYQTLKRPPVPVVKIVLPAGNPIDAFVAAQRESHSLSAGPGAEPAVLLRRVHLDLVGLPPTREEMHHFLKDPSPQAYGKVVDDLLKRRQYGERWGRHWMDVWRYSDWYGRRSQNEIRYSVRHIWRWRDWIIRSLNEDKGYDRMILEMIAGDEIAPSDPGALAATGFLGRNWYKFDRNVWLFSTVEQTSQAFLGLTMRCARCHDHKYDPISQNDYYRFRAFFEPHDVRTDPLDSDATLVLDNKKDKVLSNGLSRVFDKDLDAKTWRFERGDDRRPDKSQAIEPGTPASLGGKLKIETVSLPVEAFYPGIGGKIVAGELAKRNKQREETKAEIIAAKARVEESEKRLHSHKDSPLSAKGKMIWSDDFGEASKVAWKSLSGNWKFADGKLSQDKVTSFATLVSKRKHPRDFWLRFSYRALQPGTVRSVGLSFDYVDKGNSQDLYTSTGDKRQTVQAFHRLGGKQIYPRSGIVPTQLKVGETVTVDLEVRGQYLVVKLNGEQKLEYIMPIPRLSSGGKLAFWVHSGSAEFSDFEMREITSTKADHERELADARHDVLRAQGEQEIAKLELTAFKARVEADRAHYSNPQPPEAAALLTKALRLQAVVKTSRAELDEMNAKRHLDAVKKLGATATHKAQGDPVAEAKANLATVQKTIFAAEKRVANQSGKLEPLGEMFPETSSGRRLALARWIASAENPRTARVAINHLWLRHFGEALVPSVSDFGMAGKPPTHPQLLDWLAMELIENGWSMKKIHRLMVTSKTYQLASWSEEKVSSDPENRFYWRANSRRMEAEVVRDSVLAVSEELDVTPFGPDIDDALGLKTKRRSIYFRTTPDNQMAMLAQFDMANPNACYRREESVAPQQSLALMNGGLLLDQSRLLARRLSKTGNKDREFAQGAFERILNRAPSASELATMVHYLESEAVAKTMAGGEFPGEGEATVSPSADPVLRARENLVHVLFNHNDFVTIR